jgi:hypothetical protein
MASTDLRSGDSALRGEPVKSTRSGHSVIGYGVSDPERAGVWGASSSVVQPNGPQLFHEPVRVVLGFTPCRERIERCVSHPHILRNAPPIAATLPSVLCNIDCEGVVLFHFHIVRQRRQRRQSEIRLPQSNWPTTWKFERIDSRSHCVRDPWYAR